MVSYGIAGVNNMNRNRCLELDILKGIAILLVVIGHSGAGKVTEFIYLFHVSVFFMASGYTYHEIKDIKDFLSFIKKRIKRLYMPYVVCNLLFYMTTSAIYICTGIYDLEIKNYFWGYIKILLMAWFIGILRW